MSRATESASQAATPTYTLHEGRSPLVVSVPHAGTGVPDEIAARFTDAARALPDTDWHVHRLYAFAEALDATLIVARYSRYVIDLNRPPDDTELYPGSAQTGLCPLVTFDGTPIYARDEDRPDADEVDARRRRYWAPYHACLEAQLARVAGLHGQALLWDAHSIRSVVPRLFDGELPVLNLGTHNGASCAAPIADRVWDAARASGYPCVRDGRFRGGYITRHYGRPARGVHAIQLELAQRAYMHEAPPFQIDPDRMQALQVALRQMLEAFIEAAAKA